MLQYHTKYSFKWLSCSVLQLFVVFFILIKLPISPQSMNKTVPILRIYIIWYQLFTDCQCIQLFSFHLTFEIIQQISRFQLYFQYYFMKLIGPVTALFVGALNSVVGFFFFISMQLRFFWNPLLGLQEPLSGIMFDFLGSLIPWRFLFSSTLLTSSVVNKPVKPAVQYSIQN